MRVLIVFLKLKLEEVWEAAKENYPAILFCLYWILCAGLGVKCSKLDGIGDRIMEGILGGLFFVSVVLLGWLCGYGVWRFWGFIKSNWIMARKIVAFEAEVKKRVCPDCQRPLTFCRIGTSVYGRCNPCKRWSELYENLN